MAPRILWLRRDLRLDDHPALAAAAEAGDRVLPVFVLDERLLEQSDVRTVGLLRTLAAAQESYDGALLVRRGNPAEVLPALAAEIGATGVHVSAETEPFGRERDEVVGRALAAADVPLVRTGSPYAVTPGRVLNRTGGPYKVFTPFAAAWRDHGWRAPATIPKGLRFFRQADGDNLPAEPDTAADLPALGEDAARARWAEFLDEIDAYDEARDHPGLDATSRLSAHLKYGAIHPRTLLADLAGRRSPGVERYVTELAWREFYADVLWHRPDSAWGDYSPALKTMEYADKNDPEVASQIEAWKAGRTGFPIVDAGMRQLLATGWMHNRVRMITASFLVKHLHVWWPVGARHFLEHLVDGDVASNNHGWQWVAGTGTDAAPYFRVFNPTAQGEKFDADGAYVRRWVPELAGVEGKKVHSPGEVEGYPTPIVDHRTERAEALARYEAARA